MHPSHRRWAAALCCAGLLASSGHAQDGVTSGEALNRLFEVEGDTPFPSPYAGTLSFSAFTSRFDSGHGHGYRNELKIAEAQRRGVAQTREHFSALLTPTLPDGAKTIVAQYHVDGLDTILKVYVQDSADRKGLDGKAGNGIFDVLVKITGTDGKEVTTALGTLRSGASFALDIDFAGGGVTVAVKTDSHGTLRTPRTQVKDDNKKIYFKFGDYLQALDPATQAHTTSAARWDAYYLLHHIDASRIRFSHLIFERG